MLDVEGGDHRFLFHIAEEGDLFLHLFRNRTLAATEQDVRLDADLAKLFHRVLRRLGLQLLAGLDVGDQREMHVDGVAASDLLPELADRFQERQRLDIAHRAADLHDDHVHAIADVADALLDLVCDVGDHLHGLAEIIAATLLFDDLQIDAAGGPVVLTRRTHGGEPFVMAEVEIGLGAVVGDEDLAVLERRHRAWVDIDVGIELLQGDREPTRLEQRTDGGRGDALAKTGNNAAGDEDEFRTHCNGLRIENGEC